MSCCSKCFEMVVNARLHSCCTEDLFSTSHHGRTCRRCHHFQGEAWSPPLKPNISTQNDAMFEAVSIHLPKYQIGMLSMLVFFWGVSKASKPNFRKSKEIHEVSSSEIFGDYTHKRSVSHRPRFEVEEPPSTIVPRGPSLGCFQPAQKFDFRNLTPPKSNIFAPEKWWLDWDGTYF